MASLPKDASGLPRDGWEGGGVASLAVTRMPPPMSTMTDVVGDGGANEGETHSSSHIAVNAGAPADERQENAARQGE